MTREVLTLSFHGFSLRCTKTHTNRYTYMSHNSLTLEGNPLPCISKQGIRYDGDRLFPELSFDFAAISSTGLFSTQICIVLLFDDLSKIDSSKSFGTLVVLVFCNRFERSLLIRTGIERQQRYPVEIIPVVPHPLDYIIPLFRFYADCNRNIMGIIAFIMTGDNPRISKRLNALKQIKRTF